MGSLREEVFFRFLVLIALAADHFDLVGHGVWAIVAEVGGYLAFLALEDIFEVDHLHWLVIG